jgi:hypothetical protein
VFLLTAFNACGKVFKCLGVEEMEEMDMRKEEHQERVKDGRRLIDRGRRSARSVFDDGSLGVRASGLFASSSSSATASSSASPQDQQPVVGRGGAKGAAHVESRTQRPFGFGQLS